MARVCLNMIVKNEVSNLERCLSAVVDHIDCWAIADTGSSDGTQDFIKEFFGSRNIPGVLVQCPFHNFAQARNFALETCKNSLLDFDYILLVDADMELVVEDRQFRAKLAADVYSVLQRHGISYWNRRILKRSAISEYRGVTHEFLDVNGEKQNLSGIWFIDHASGSNRVEKYSRDINLLEDALTTEKDYHLRIRYQFYLAQSYRDSGLSEKAIEAYERRIAMNGWDEEIWYSAYQIARIHEHLGSPDETVLAAYLRAFEFRPTRAEALCELAAFLRRRQRYVLGHLVATRAKDIPRPTDILFISEDVYAWRSLDEFAIAAYWVGDYRTSADVCDRLLADSALPPGQRPRIEQNLRFAIEKLPAVGERWTSIAANA